MLLTSCANLRLRRIACINHLNVIGRDWLRGSNRLPNFSDDEDAVLRLTETLNVFLYCFSVDLQSFTYLLELELTLFVKKK